MFFQHYFQGATLRGREPELLAQRGLYHRMFTAQAAWYQRT